MSARHVLDELSAYIDGECTDPQRVTRHLQSCPDCAQRHMELLKLSNILGGMDPPEVGPLFAARVLASVEAHDAAPSHFARLQGRPAIAMAATIAVALAGFVLSLDRSQGPAAPAPVTVGSVAWVDEAWMDDEAVISALGEVLDSDLWEDPFGLHEDGGDQEPAPSLDDLLDGLAALALDDGEAAWYEQEDLISVLDALAREDVQVLGELTENLWKEG